MLDIHPTGYRFNVMSHATGRLIDSALCTSPRAAAIMDRVYSGERFKNASCKIEGHFERRPEPPVLPPGQSTTYELILADLHAKRRAAEIGDMLFAFKFGLAIIIPFLILMTQLKTIVFYFERFIS